MLITWCNRAMERHLNQKGRNICDQLLLVPIWTSVTVNVVIFLTPLTPPPPEKRNIYSLGTCGLLKQVTFLSFSRLSNSIMIVTGAPVRLKEAIHMRHHPDNIIRYSGIENTRACKSTIKKHMRQSVTEVKQWRNEHQPVGLMMGNERNQTHQWQPESSCSR